MVPAMMPGNASGQSTRRNIARARAEAERGLLDRAVDAFDHALQRQHHERQVDRDDADDDRGSVNMISSGSR